MNAAASCVPAVSNTAKAATAPSEFRLRFILISLCNVGKDTPAETTSPFSPEVGRCFEIAQTQAARTPVCEFLCCHSPHSLDYGEKLPSGNRRDCALPHSRNRYSTSTLLLRPQVGAGRCARIAAKAQQAGGNERNGNCGIAGIRTVTGLPEERANVENDGPRRERLGGFPCADISGNPRQR